MSLGCIQIYDEKQKLSAAFDDSSLLITINKKEIGPNELKPFFRYARDAEDVLEVFNKQYIKERLAAEDKSWRLIVMPDKGLVLAKTFTHHSQKYQFKNIPITVAVRSNGLFLYRKPLSKQNPPQLNDLFLKINPSDIEPELLSELFVIMDAAEITAVFRMNRRELIRLLPANTGSEQTRCNENSIQRM